jgi:hypothetical protein
MAQLTLASPLPESYLSSHRAWNAYDNHYWPARYLIGADGFIRYQHWKGRAPTTRTKRRSKNSYPREARSQVERFDLGLGRAL